MSFVYVVEDGSKMSIDGVVPLKDVITVSLSVAVVV